MLAPRPRGVQTQVKGFHRCERRPESLASNCRGLVFARAEEP